MSILLSGSENGVQRVTSPANELADWEQLALEVAQVGSWEWDFERGAGRSSCQLRSVLGIEQGSAALGPDGLLSFVLEGDRERYKASLFAAIEGAGQHNLEYRIERPDGRVRWVFDRAKVLTNESGQPVRMLGALIDITDNKHEEFALREIQRAANAKKKAEKALLETEHRLNAILDNAPAAVYVKDMTGRLTFVNRCFLEIFQMNRTEVLKERKVPQHPPDILSVLREHDRAVLDAGQALQFEEEIEVQGVRRTFMSVKFPLLDPEGKPYSLCGISADVTDRKVSQQEVIDRTHELQKAIEDLNQITYLVSHDMRSPLRGIISNSRIVREDFGADISEGAKMHLARIESAALKLGRLVDDLLGYVRIGRTEILAEPVDVSEVARRVITSLKNKLDLQGAVFDIESDIHLQCDREALSTILYSLLHNACQYVQTGCGPQVRLASIPGGFCIEDEGIGIEMQYAEKIFQPFERLHRDMEYLGTGMGLAKAARLVERHGGRIWVESRPGLGSRFSVQLPELARADPK